MGLYKKNQDGESLFAGSGKSVVNHNDLTGRDANNSHPISAITDLQATLDNMQSEVNTITNEVVQARTEIAAKASNESVSDLQTEMAVQTARMDQLVGEVPPGSADEIADARVMVDGKIATNLGDAIRTQAALLKEQLATKYYVGYGKTDNVRYFQKLTDCLWKVSETDGKKEIYIHDGTYDVLEELGGMSYILSKNTTDNTYREVHPFVSDAKIIGVGHVVLNFLLDDGTPRENYWLFSCLGISGNCYIENIEIHSKNCRYSIHDESAHLYPDTERHYKNVRCYQNETGGVGGQAVGCGFSERTRVTIENCYFGARYEAWSCHANDGCTFVFKDTVFESYMNSTHSLRISQNNGTSNLYATISSCFLDKGLSIRDEGEDPVVKDKTRIDLVNTKVPNLVNGYSTITQPITSYNTLDGTKTVLLATN